MNQKKGISVCRKKRFGVFLIWSGDRSKALAKALHGWLPQILKTVNPWMSERDTPKGANWLSNLSRSLKEVNVGVVCLTPERQQSPWIMFETGAIAGTLDMGKKVFPYCIGQHSSDIQGPIRFLQGSNSNEEETLTLVLEMNKELGMPERESAITVKFRKHWPSLEKKIRKISGMPGNRFEGPWKYAVKSELKDLKYRGVATFGKSRDGDLLIKGERTWESVKGKKRKISRSWESLFVHETSAADKLHFVYNITISDIGHVRGFCTLNDIQGNPAEKMKGTICYLSPAQINGTIIFRRE